MQKTVFYLLPLLFALWGCAGEGEAALSLGEDGTIPEAEGVQAEEAAESPLPEENAGIAEAEAAPEEWYVYVTGAVERPGVYQVSPGARIFEAVEMAGGLKEEADYNYVNQAAFLSDGEMIRILTKEEALENPVSPSAGEGFAKPPAGDGRIDLNRADAGALMTLPGIGEAKAERILEFREEKGGFQSIEELKQVEGIGEATFARLKERIKVEVGG